MPDRIRLGTGTPPAPDDAVQLWFADSEGTARLYRRRDDGVVEIVDEGVVEIVTEGEALLTPEEPYGEDIGGTVIFPPRKA